MAPLERDSAQAHTEQSGPRAVAGVRHPHDPDDTLTALTECEPVRCASHSASLLGGEAMKPSDAGSWRGSSRRIDIRMRRCAIELHCVGTGLGLASCASSLIELAVGTERTLLACRL
jgi:hypothetical protein